VPSSGDATPSPVLVTDGTGRLGRRLVPRLRDAGCQVRVLTRSGYEACDGIGFRHRRPAHQCRRGRAGGLLPVILILAHAEEDYAELIAASPAVGFLPKTALSAPPSRPAGRPP
jgi:nucleoside-diphosphate-sugar epimerase